VGTGVGSVHCVEPDLVELSNLSRQCLYTESDVGTPKLDSALRRLRSVNSDVRISGERTRITNVEQLRRLAETSDAVAICADEPPEIRAWANRAALDTGTPWVDGGYNGPLVSATAYRPGTGPCYQCVRIGTRERHPRVTSDPDRTPLNPVSAASAGISGHLVAHLLLALLTGVPAVPSGRVCALNLVALGEQFAVDYPHRPDCPECGDR
jgi:molybdopterin-synthase adenylyltransferase